MTEVGAKRRGGGEIVWPLLSPILARIGAASLLLLLISVVVFLLMYLIPGDLVRTLLGSYYERASPETISEIRERYRLDDPFWVQYITWLSNAMQGDFGNSIRYRSPVTEVVGERAGPTALLAALSFGLGLAIALPLGVLTAIRAGGRADRTVTATAVLLGSAPSFALALVLIWLFGVQLRIFPIYGVGSGGISTLWHFALPSITLALGLAAGLIKLTRTAVINELSKDYVTALRAHGVGETRVRRIVLRNASIPVATGGGMILAFLLTGTVLVETVFSIPGLGMLLQDAVLFKDVPVVQLLALLIAATIVGVTLLVDLLYLALDPRLRRPAAVSK